MLKEIKTLLIAFNQFIFTNVKVLNSVLIPQLAHSQFYCGEGEWFYGGFQPNEITFSVMTTRTTSTGTQIALGGSTLSAQALNSAQNNNNAAIVMMFDYDIHEPEYASVVPSLAFDGSQVNAVDIQALVWIENMDVVAGVLKSAALDNPLVFFTCYGNTFYIGRMVGYKSGYGSDFNNN